MFTSGEVFIQIYIQKRYKHCFILAKAVYSLFRVVSGSRTIRMVAYTLYNEKSLYLSDPVLRRSTWPQCGAIAARVKDKKGRSM